MNENPQPPAAAPTPPATTGTPGTIYSNPPTMPLNTPPAFDTSKQKRRRILIAAGAAAAVIAIGVGGYVFGYYLPNKPENVYKTALSRTSKGYETLVDYANDPKVTDQFKATETNGTFKFKQEGVTTDGSYQAKAGNGNVVFSGDISAQVARIKVEGIIKDVSSSDAPDIYVKASGLKGLGNGYLDVDSLDNQWVTVDHTLLENIMERAVPDSKDTLKMPSRTDVMDAFKSMGDVSNKYLFTTNKDVAVLEMRSFVGKEKTDDKDTLHYTVGANKDHLKAYTKELKDSIDKTKLNDWAKANYDKPLSELLDMDQLVKEAEDYNTGDTFDLWVNAKTKMVHKVRFADKDKADKQYVELGLNYESGTSYPFFYNTKDEDENFKMTVVLDTAKNTVKLTTNTTEGKNEDQIEAEIKPLKDNVSPDAPKDAISLAEALDVLGLPGFLDYFEEETVPAISDELFTFTQ